MLAPVNTPTAIGGLLQAKSATLQYYCCADLDRCSPPRYGQRLHQTEFHIPEHYHTVFASAFLSRFRIIPGKLEEPIRLAEGPFCQTIAYWYPSLQCRVDHLFPQVRPRQMNIFEGRFLLLVPHRHRQLSLERAWWSWVGQVNGRDDDASRSDLCRPSLPRRDHQLRGMAVFSVPTEPAHS